MTKAIVLDFFGVLWLESGLNTDMLEEVRAMQGEYTFLILSNMGRGGFNDRMPQEYQVLFDKIFLSGETGNLKPHPEAYEQIKDYLAPLDPGEILFIDDVAYNAQAAQTQGLKSFHYREPISLVQVLGLDSDSWSSELT